MKIVSLRLQNLGSLAGTWHIDFTDPAFEENSIFAITGPTGAGKSTLLDGLCLALYGATPRLGKITKSSNQIMSRHSGTCFAEVEFSTNKGIFRCHWSQHRSRNKSRGELQQPRHEIVDADNNSVLASKIRDVAVQVEAVTGMDFDRFTRSTLLAQGGFAAFLQASDDERSPILEQITGTEVYSNISKKVHELYQVEQTKLRDCEQIITGINLLPAEEEQQLNEKMKRADTESLAITASLKELTIQHSWLTNLQRLKTELKTYQEQLNALEKEKEGHIPQLRSLKEALAAKEIEPLHRILEGLKAFALETEGEIIDLQQKQLGLTERQSQQLAQIQTASTTQNLTERNREEGLKLIREVRKLDSNIDNATRQYEKQAIDYYASKEKYAKNHGHLDKLHHTIKQAKSCKKLLDDYFLRNGPDEQLLEKIGTMESLLARIEELNGQYKTLLAIKKELHTNLNLYDKQTATLANKLNLIKMKNSTNTLLLKQIHEQIVTLQQGSNPDGLLQKQFRTATRHKSLLDLILLIEQGVVYEKERTHLEEQQRTNVSNTKELSHKLNTAKMIGAGQQKSITLLEKNILLLIRVQSLEEDRQQLKDNHPCPLCGSTTHPYSVEQRPEVAEEELQLQLAKSKQAETEEAISHISDQIIRAKEQAKSQLKEIAEKGRQISTCKKAIQQLMADLDFPDDFEASIIPLRQEKEKMALLQKELKQQIRDLGKLKEEEETLTKERDKSGKTRQTLDLAMAEARIRSAATTKELKEYSKRKNDLEKELKQHNTDLSQMLLPHITQDHHADTHSAQLLNFRERIERWKAKKDEEKGLATQLVQLSTEYKHTAILCTSEEKKLLQLRTACKLDKSKLQNLQEKRSSLFATKKTDEEEVRLEQQTTDARKKVTLFQQELDRINTDLTTVTTLLKRLGKETEKNSKEMAAQQQRFQKAIETSSFNSSEEFIKAQLTPEETNRLQQLHTRLKQREDELNTLCRERQASLRFEQERKLCSDTMPLLEERIREKEDYLKKLQIQAMGIREQLKRNSADKEKLKGQLEAIARQKEISGRWGRLHMLIGSADGKKFRNFAQGLTFELMVHHANSHLKRMSKRYILIRDTNSPLDLNVIDTYQADEIRSTKNLSGGESFLVSLALALGLSRMASRNVRVDSLFLDEGFGTLDENALESALDTLARLREDNKLIGVISHVRTLQERVPLQIRIIPGSGGISRISGPGVSRDVE